MIDPRTKEIIEAYVQESRKRKWSRQEFAWSWEEEINLSLQREIIRYCMAKYMDAKVTNVGWGFRMEFKHG